MIRASTGRGIVRRPTRPHKATAPARARTTAPTSTERQQAAAPAHTDTSRPSAGRVRVGRTPATRAHRGPAASTDHKGAGRPPVRASAASAGSTSAASLVLGGPLQQEVDVLRGQLGVLSFASVWQAANPPRFTGVYGALLQGFMAGDQLSSAFAHVNHGAAALRDGTYAGLALVRAHKPIRFTAKG